MIDLLANRSLRRIAADCVALGTATVLAFVISAALIDGRIGGLILTLSTLGVWATFTTFGALLHVHQTIWHRISVQDLVPVSMAAFLCAAMSAVFFWLFDGRVLGGLTNLAIGAVLYFNALIVPRAFIRIIYRTEAKTDAANGQLLVGSLALVDTFIRGEAARAQKSGKIIGILTDSSEEQGGRLLGVPILGRSGDLELIHGYLDNGKEALQEVILVREDGPFSDSELAVVDACNRINLPVRQVIAFSSSTASRDQLSSPKPIRLDDILGRAINLPDTSNLRTLVTGKTVLVTGAGGSIGSEICKQIYVLEPSVLVLLDHSEFAVFTVRETLRDMGLGREESLVPRVVSICDEEALKALFAAQKPDIVFHAAALKHVNLVEENPLEAIKTNIFGTKHVLEAASENGCSSFVMISTDKAVRPTSLMGATKRVAELVCQRQEAIRLAETPDGGMRVISVRFGNVLGSSGSVIPIFQRQIERGGPITVRHKDVTRYFMMIPEAVGLVLSAFEWSVLNRASQSDVIVLDMGEPVRIYDLAEQIIRMSGFVPNKDIEIKITGMLPGEKLYEELFDDREQKLNAGNDRVFAARAHRSDETSLNEALGKLSASIGEKSPEKARNIIAELVPDNLFTS